MKMTSDDEKETCLGVVSVLDPLLGAALDRPTCSPALPTISRNVLSELYNINEHACPKQQYTCLALP
jgi:hypothetical protein